MTAEVSIAECVALAEWVYDTSASPPPRCVGWKPSNPMPWGDGFAATCFTKNETSVIAFRGTEPLDPLDLWADWQMLPGVPSEQLGNAANQLLRAYSLTERLNNVESMILNISKSPSFRLAVEHTANRLPRVQGQQALRFFDEHRRCLAVPPICVVGHSLGGALAQLVGLKRNVPAIAFNAPNVGGLEGGEPITSMHILHVNADLDPVSLVTRHAGNLPHGREVILRLPPPDTPLPQIPRSRVRRALQRTIVGIEDIPGVVFDLASMPLLNAMDAADRLEYNIRLLIYTAAVAGHYHSITRLRQALAAESIYRQPFGDFLPEFRKAVQ